MISDGATRDDIKQGILGDCWFLSACAAVSQKENFMKKVSCKIYFYIWLKETGLILEIHIFGIVHVVCESDTGKLGHGHVKFKALYCEI